MSKEIFSFSLAFLCVLLWFGIGDEACSDLPLNYRVSDGGCEIAHVEIRSRKGIQGACFFSRIPRLLPGW